jgi:hypothetical protein
LPDAKKSKPTRSEKGGKKAASEKREKITLECTNPVTDGIMDTAALEKCVVVLS